MSQPYRCGNRFFFVLVIGVETDLAFISGIRQLTIPLTTFSKASLKLKQYRRETCIFLTGTRILYSLACISRTPNKEKEPLCLLLTSTRHSVGHVDKDVGARAFVVGPKLDSE